MAAELQFDVPGTVSLDYAHLAAVESPKEGIRSSRQRDYRGENQALRGLGLSSEHDLWPGGDGQRRLHLPGSGSRQRDDQDFNPHPSTWKYDDDGHLLSAGLGFYAKYDAKGQIGTVVMDGQVWEQTAAGVTRAYTDGDGHWQIQENPGATLSVKTYGSDQDIYRGAMITIHDEDGHASTYSHPLYQSPTS